MAVAIGRVWVDEGLFDPAGLDSFFPGRAGPALSVVF